MSKPRLLDLLSGAGGCAAGYVRAGFEVTGVDVREQPRYLLSGASAFVQGDALEYLAKHGREFDAIHASPPCQRYTKAARIHQSEERHPDLVAPCRELLEASGRPWIIENVPGSPLRRAVMLCGAMFGLKVFRHRFFESSVVLLAPPHPRHRGRTAPRGSHSTVALSVGGYVTVAGNNFIREEGMAAMGIGWEMSRREVANAIPPAMTEYLGRQLIAALE